MLRGKFNENIYFTKMSKREISKIELDIFGSLIMNETKHQTILQNHFVNPNQPPENHREESVYYAYQEPIVSIPDPKASIWEFLSKQNLGEYLKLDRTSDIKSYLNTMKMDKYYPKGMALNVFIELMCSVTKFCKKCNFTLEKSGALLSQFFLTHILATSGFDRTTEKVYTYYKELSLAHTLPDFPPKSAKIFSQDETKRNMEFFCHLYLRNLPLIRFICLPNFAFLFEYEVEKAEKEKITKKKSKKEKKGDKKGSKGGSKKSKK